MQVSDILKICSTHGIPVVPYGGGTSLEGQILSPKRALSIDFKNMRKVLELNVKVRQDKTPRAYDEKNRNSYLHPQ